MPVVHIHVAEGLLTPSRKRRIANNVIRAVVETEDVPESREATYALVHEVPDGGWDYRDSVPPHVPFAR